jgi:hypothetical protein
MKTLDEIKYQFIINLTKFFLYKYKLGEIKNLEQIGNNSYLPFRLFVNGEMNQEALSIFSSVYKTK